MKIISKFKDYYDYLQGIYGIDELLVLDRTTFYNDLNLDYYKENDTISIILCGLVYEGIFKSGKFRYGKDIEEFLTDKDHTYKDRYSIKTSNTRYGYIDISINPKEYKILDHPIYLKIRETDSEPVLVLNPILKNYNFHTLFSAEDIWIEISNFLSRPKEIKNNQSNKEKIVTAGFDLKTSFRKM